MDQEGCQDKEDQDITQVDHPDQVMDEDSPKPRLMQTLSQTSADKEHLHAERISRKPAWRKTVDELISVGLGKIFTVWPSLSLNYYSF